MRWSALEERLTARVEVAGLEGSVEATVGTMSEDELERVAEQIRELARLVGVSQA